MLSRHEKDRGKVRVDTGRQGDRNHMGGGGGDKEVKRMEGGGKRKEMGWRWGSGDSYSGGQSREGRGDGKSGDEDTGPLGTCCVCRLSSWLGGQTWGSRGSTQDSGQRGGAAPQDVKSPGGRGVRAGAGWSPAWSGKGGPLGAQRVRGPGDGGGLDLEGREGDGQQRQLIPRED